MDVSKYTPWNQRWKSSFLLFRISIRGSLLNPADLHPTNVDDYIEEIKVAITSAMNLVSYRQYTESTVKVQGGVWQACKLYWEVI